MVFLDALPLLTGWGFQAPTPAAFRKGSHRDYRPASLAAEGGGGMLEMACGGSSQEKLLGKAGFN